MECVISFVCVHARNPNEELSKFDKGGVTEIFLGSTSNYVMHKAKIPVLIIK